MFYSMGIPTGFTLMTGRWMLLWFSLFAVSLHAFTIPLGTSNSHLVKWGLSLTLGRRGCEAELQFYCVGLEIDSILPGPAFS